jgi:signal transduction histidine kinase
MSDNSSIGVALMRIQDAQMIKESEKRLRDLLNEKDKFFSIIAHDLKSPMSGLLLLSRMLADNPESFTPEELQEATNTMFKSSEQLYALLENLLHWALMQQGMVDFSLRPKSLQDLVHASMESLRSVSGQKGIALQSLVSEKIMARVDVPMISTVLRNLISNALKFTDRGGSVIVSASRNFDMVKVVVKDTGMGMGQDSLDQIFTLEKKKVVPGTQGETGTGLGLVLCKEFIEKHGGQIWLKSEPGLGTTVFFTLPAA